MAHRDGFAPVMQHLLDSEQRLRARGLTARDALMAWMDDWQAGRLPQAILAADPRLIDLPGMAYQHFLSYRFKAKLGQFFTPRPIARLLVERARIDTTDTVLDPFAGSGGLLALCAPRASHVLGFELDTELAGFACRTIGAEVVLAADAFTQHAQADVVITNPPFSLVVRDRTVLDQYGINAPSSSSEHLFALALHRWVAPTGRAAVVLPHSVLTSKRHRAVRQALAEHFAVHRVCELPEGVFRPFGGAQGRAVLLWLTRRPARFTQWARVADPGYDVTRRIPRATGSTELHALEEEGAWTPLPLGDWRPQPNAHSGSTVAAVATRVHDLFRQSATADADVCVLDLADVNGDSGHARPTQRRTGTLRGGRRVLRAGDVCVSRLRPEKGLVTVVPPCEHPIVGSSEWVVLRCARPHLLFHLLRTPAWRRGLPEPSGQTRPRVKASEVLQTRLATPSAAVSQRIEEVSERLHAARRDVEVQLACLQRAVDAFADGDMDESELEAQVQAMARARVDSGR